MNREWPTPSDGVYVVHCRRLRERKESLEPVLHRLGWTVEWIEAFDPAEIPSSMKPRRRPTRGEASVYLKHVEAFRRVSRAAGAMALVLEDDALFPEGFAETFATYLGALPPDTDMAFFGASCGLTVPADNGNPYFGREHGTRSMSGYLITAACARVLLDALDGQPIAKTIDLTINDVVRARGLVVYWSVPALIENGSETGRFPHSLGVSWRAASPLGRLARAYATFKK